ncbi:hypothetical protein ACFQZF_07685 [Flavobacterium myungsuense]|uniref:Lipoprotein n=1 Tax=Flavobacterium myungsuense TaxID=651823 RepID=A0ABW3J5J0_9FLAO
MKFNTKLLLGSSIILSVFYSCNSESNTDSTSSNSEASNRLHFSFKTPDWERWVDCDLDFPANAKNDSTNIISFYSASTKAALCFTYPKDSSKIVKNRELKKYKIKSYLDNEEPFQFSQKLPLDQNSLDDLSKKLVSNEGFSDEEYNQVTEVKYIKSETNYSIFRVKCSYKLKARIISTPEISKPVSGTFTFLVRTTKI